MACSGGGCGQDRRLDRQRDLVLLLRSHTHSEVPSMLRLHPLGARAVSSRGSHMISSASSALHTLAVHLAQGTGREGGGGVPTDGSLTSGSQVQWSVIMLHNLVRAAHRESMGPGGIHHGGKEGGEGHSR